MFSQRVKAHLATITANVLFALNYSYSKSIIPDWISPGGLSLARIVSAMLMFTLLAVTFVREKIERKDIFKLILASTLGIAGSQYTFLMGLNLSSPVDASIIATSGPVIVLVLSSLLKRDKVTLLKSIGIGVGACGAMLVILYGGIANFGTGHLTGNLVLFLSTFFYSSYLILVKDLAKKYSPLTMMSWIFGISALIMMPLLWDNLVVDTAWSEIPTPIWGAIIFVIVGATLISYLCIATGLKTLKATTVSMYSYSQPIIASYVAIMRGQDTFDWVKLAAALLVFSGVFLVTQSYRFEREQIGV